MYQRLGQAQLDSGLALSMSHFFPNDQPPEKMLLTSKVIKSDLAIFIKDVSESLIHLILNIQSSRLKLDVATGFLKQELKTMAN